MRRWALVVLLVGAGCGDRDRFSGLFRSESPYQEYLNTLKNAGLDQTALGREWIRAGEQALARPVTAKLPFRETGYFPPHTPGAVAYRLELRRGRKLTVEVSFDTERPARLFVDLFQRVDTNPPHRVASLSPGDSSLTYDVRHDGTYLLRLQPELLGGGRWTLIERTEASLDFPIPGFGVRAVRSRFGVDRDAGRRWHQGIDIFAPRGTPAVAVVDGFARASTNELGGNVVWLSDPARGRTFYYAHLDRWAATVDADVRAGDTVGFIGSTGNARTTPPHLHFGIYEGGPVDPLPFLEPDDPAPPVVTAPSDRLDEWVRVSAVRAVLRSGAHRDADTLRRLDRGWIARVSAASQGAFRVTLPDETVGYLAAEAVTRAESALRREQLDAGTVLSESPNHASPAVFVVTSALAADILGRFGDYELARLPDGRLGWVGPRPRGGG